MSTWLQGMAASAANIPLAWVTTKFTPRGWPSAATSGIGIIVTFRPWAAAAPASEATSNPAATSKINRENPLRECDMGTVLLPPTGGYRAILIQVRA